MKQILSGLIVFLFVAVADTQAQSTRELILQGIVLDESGQHYEAVTTFNMALDEDRSLGYVYYYRGRAKARLDDYHGAISDLNRAVEMVNNYAEAYLWRGMAHKKLRKQSDAIKDFDNAIDIYPSYPDAFFHRGVSKIFLNDREGGCLDLSRAGELGHTKAYEQIRKYCN